MPTSFCQGITPRFTSLTDVLLFGIRIGALETNARSRVERTFRVFPYTRSSTTIFEMQDLEPLQKMMIDNEMTEEDLAECRKVRTTEIQHHLLRLLSKCTHFRLFTLC